MQGPCKHISFSEARWRYSDPDESSFLETKAYLGKGGIVKELMQEESMYSTRQPASSFVTTFGHETLSKTNSLPGESSSMLQLMLEFPNRSLSALAILVFSVIRDNKGSPLPSTYEKPMETLDCRFCFVMVGINDDNRNRDEARDVLAMC